MIIKKPELSGIGVKRSQFPEPRKLDIVLAGRSNVGKSSLINKLINRKGLARTSSTPGKTRTINFYGINEDLYFVDLPGYGYAKVSHDQRDDFRKMVDEYFAANRNREIWQLVDSRHPPSALDVQMCQFLKSTGLPFTVIATKADKLSKNQLAKNKAVILKDLALENSQLVLFSTETGMGKDELIARIDGSLEILNQ